MIEKFLHIAAKKIIEQSYTDINSVIILPNRRSEIFLREEIKRLNSKNIWLPEIISVEEFTQSIARLKKADSITTSFLLYDAYFNIETSNAKPIEEFLTWVPVMINDFNDIDNSMIDAKVVYEQLTAVKAIQLWNPNGIPLSQLQKNYIRFFNSMYDYYTMLKAKLFEQNIGFQGMINRYLAENINTLSKNIQWSKFLIVGMNAFSEAEMQIFDFINKKFKTEFVWDIDPFYFDKENHEAARNIKKIIGRLNLPSPQVISSHFEKSNKKIKILGVPKNIGQVKYVAQELNTLNQKTNDTALVLPDEKLIIPLLNSLPIVNDQSYNITLGYPLEDSIIANFFDNWIYIIDCINSGSSIDSFQLIKLLDNPFTVNLIDNKDNIALKITRIISKEHLSRLNVGQLREKLLDIKNGDLLLKLFNNCKPTNPNELLTNLKNIIIEFVGQQNNLDLILVEQINNLILIISKLTYYIDSNKHNNSISLVKKISKTIFQQSTMNLVGKPLVGIQIMGMLETRALDFDNIYIFNMNEGTVPAKISSDSFIPYDLRHQLNLPMPSDKTDIYSYNFFRLLQRANNITLLYDSDGDELGGGEKSRYILQIINELKKQYNNITVKNQIIKTNLSQHSYTDNKSNQIIIKKNSLIQSSLLELLSSGFSASSFIDYITCNLKFYFRKIIKLKPETGLKLNIEPNTFGTVIHQTLEDIYKDQLNTYISVERINWWLKNYEKLLISSFQKHYNDSGLFFGKNLLTYEVAKVYILNLLKWELKNQLKNSSKIIGIEENMLCEKTIKDYKSAFVGVIDRVDSLNNGNTIRVIDYKTGFVSQEQLKVKDTDLLLTEQKYSKAFQVLFYAWLYNNAHPGQNIEAGILSTRSISNGFMPVILDQYNSITEYLPNFERSINTLVTNIMDSSVPFTQTTDLKNCEYCDYKSICNR